MLNFRKKRNINVIFKLKNNFIFKNYITSALKISGVRTYMERNWGVNSSNSNAAGERTRATKASAVKIAAVNACGDKTLV